MAVPLIPIAIGLGAAATAAAGIAVFIRSGTKTKRLLRKAWRLVKSQSPDDLTAQKKLCPHERCMMFTGGSTSMNNLYVVLLKKKVLKERPEFGTENRHYKPPSKLPCVYVGTTSCEPCCRFQQHLAGYNAGRGYVTNYGKRLTSVSEYDPAGEFPPNPVPKHCAEELEALLAQWLREKGWAVWSR